MLALDGGIWQCRVGPGIGGWDLAMQCRYWHWRVGSGDAG